MSKFIHVLTTLLLYKKENLLVIFTLTGFFMRSFGCTINQFKNITTKDIVLIIK